MIWDNHNHKVHYDPPKEYSTFTVSIQNPIKAPNNTPISPPINDTMKAPESRKSSDSTLPIIPEAVQNPESPNDSIKTHEHVNQEINPPKVQPQQDQQAVTQNQDATEYPNDSSGSTIFDPKLRFKLKSGAAINRPLPYTDLEQRKNVRTFTTLHGEEMYERKGKCSKRLKSFDQNQPDLWSFGKDCGFSQSESDLMIRNLKRALDQRNK